VTCFAVPVKRVAEEQEWYNLSSQSLEEAYDEDEPEYSLDMIKNSNPEYRP
jgi:hypothetical protein